MFCCAHDPGLALLLAEDENWPDQAASPATIRIILISILALNAAALLLIGLG